MTKKLELDRKTEAVHHGLPVTDKTVLAEKIIKHLNEACWLSMAVFVYFDCAAVQGLLTFVSVNVWTRTY